MLWVRYEYIFYMCIYTYIYIYIYAGMAALLEVQARVALPWEIREILKRENEIDYRGRLVERDERD